MIYRYVVVCSTFVKPGDIRVSYGMAYVDEDMVAVKCYGDLSCNCEAVSELVDRCNKYKLDPIHMEDIIEDFLS